MRRRASGAAANGPAARPDGPASAEDTERAQAYDSFVAALAQKLGDDETTVDAQCLLATITLTGLGMLVGIVLCIATLDSIALV